MQLLSLFDTAELAPPVEEVLVPQKAPPPQRPEIDPEFMEDLQSWKPGAGTIKTEIEFLTRYVERFGFARDQRRLKTLEYYLEQLG